MTLTYRLYENEDLGQTVDLVQRVFAKIEPDPLGAWQKLESHDHVTVLASDGGRIVGAIPFDLRDFLVRPGVCIRAAFCHLVSVDEAYRNQGVGSGMMALARKAFPQFCDGLFVYTETEAHAPYTFYERNGFVDLLYSRFYTARASPADLPACVQVVPFDIKEIDEAALNQVYQRVYQGYGGFPPRRSGYWRGALDSIIYIQIPFDFYLATTSAGSYAIFGIHQRGYTQILELSVNPGDPASLENLLRAVMATGAERGASKIKLCASRQHPARASLDASGFRPGSRKASQITAARLLHLDRVWAQLTRGQDAPALRIWTPTGSFDLPGTGSPVTLEMKDDTLTRLFLCREDPGCLVETGRVTSPNWNLPLEQLQSIFQPAPWVYHPIDYI